MPGIHKSAPTKAEGVAEMSNEREEMIKVPKSLVMVKARSITRNCENCKFCDYFGDYGLHSCEQWGAIIDAPSERVCKAFKKDGAK